MQFPRIHLNGSSAEYLMEQYQEAVERVHHAISALRSIDVNGRDYYVISDDAASVAMREHRARIASLETVVIELTAIWENIDGQAGERKP